MKMSEMLSKLDEEDSVVQDKKGNHYVFFNEIEVNIGDKTVYLKNDSLKVAVINSNIDIESVDTLNIVNVVGFVKTNLQE